MTISTAIRRWFAQVLLLVLTSPALVLAQRTDATPHGTSSAFPPLTGLPHPLPDPSFADTTHTYWSRRDGAPGGITALAQTKDGYLWVGSTLGLYRFDGLRFSPYPFGITSAPLPSLDVTSLSADSGGGLWISLRNPAIVHLNPDGTSVTYGVSSGLQADMIEKVIARPDGSVFAFGGSKLFKLQSDKWINFGKQHGLRGGGVFSVLFDHEGNIWMGRDKAVWVLRNGASEFERLPQDLHYVSSMIQSRSGEIWVADAWRSVRPLASQSADGVMRLHGKAEMLLDSRDNLWIAQDDEGLARIRSIDDTSGAKEVETASADELSSARTHAILEDREENVWVGTDRGLDRYQKTTFVHFRATTLVDFPALLATDDGSVWINSHGSPLMRVQNGSVNAIGPNLNTGPLVARKNGQVCFIDLTTNALLCYDDTHVVSTTPVDPRLKHPPPLLLVEDSDGSLLASFYSRGLWRISDAAWDKVIAPGLPEADIWGMLLDSHNRLWLGYNDGRVVMRENGRYQTLAVTGAPWSRTVTFYEADGVIFGAGPHGICMYHNGQMLALHPFQENLFRGTSGMAIDRSGNLWLNSGAGVLRISASELQTVIAQPSHLLRAEIFDENDGLTGQPTQSKPAPSAVVATDGTLWFSMGGDIVTLDPSTIAPPRTLPLVRIESVLVNATPILGTMTPPSGALRINGRGLRQLEINYIGINLSAPERVFYRYRLVGEDRTWQDVGTRQQAFYTRLQPGNYRFEVSANNGHDWSDLSIPLRIEITPAYYQTLWFKILCILSVAGLTWFILQRRMYQATEKVHNRLSARMAERERVARELHDTLLQGFQGLLIRFDLIARSITNNDAPRAELEDALDRADELLAEGRDRISDLRYESSNKEPLPESLEEFGTHHARGRKTEVHLSISGFPQPLDPVSYQEITATSKEAIINSLRHGDPTNLWIDVKYTMTHLTVQIIDDGRGIDPTILNAKKRENHWGLAGMRERAVNLKADLRFSANSPCGTVVSLRVPAEIAYRRSDGSNQQPRLWTRRIGRLAKWS